MANIIHQKVSFSASSATSFNIYLDPKKHGTAIDDVACCGSVTSDRPESDDRPVVAREAAEEERSRLDPDFASP
jgi:hypothetical protein